MICWRTAGMTLGSVDGWWPGRLGSLPDGGVMMGLVVVLEWEGNDKVFKRIVF